MWMDEIDIDDDHSWNVRDLTDAVSSGLPVVLSEDGRYRAAVVDIANYRYLLMCKAEVEGEEWEGLD